MKKLWVLTAVLIFPFLSCNDNKTAGDDKVKTEELAYSIYGEKISSDQSLTSAEMQEKYANLDPGDTISVSFRTTVNSVCKKKGCWMNLNLPEGDEDVMVSFKDYGFFVPMDIEQKEVIVNGKAYIAEVSVEEQKHYAEDNGQTEAEIASITEPKRTLSFLADGVLLKK